MTTLKAVRGTRDLLPPETALWNRIESIARSVFARYNFGEIRTPIFEDTALFARGVGEETDIVSKEMYTWEDGKRPRPKLLREAWLRQNKDRGIRTKPATGFGHAVFLENVLIEDRGEWKYFEFRANPPRRVEGALLRRVRVANNLGLPIVVVVSEEELHKIDKVNFQMAGVALESTTGRFVTSAQSLTLRPENTAGVVRAYIENKLGESGQLQKLFYIGPQFRR